MNRQEQQLMADLIRSRRWAALATHSADGPDASWVAYASEADFGGFLLHLSTLAAHTRNLLASARAALAISAASGMKRIPLCSQAGNGMLRSGQRKRVRVTMVTAVRPMIAVSVQSESSMLVKHVVGH